jgi:hypothetical protein
MKIQILKTTDINDCIDGYAPVFVENGKVTIDAPSNSISSILMNNSIEEIPYLELNSFLQQVTRLLRLGGELIFSGIDINCLCRDVLNRSITPETYNTVVYNRKSIYDSKELADKIANAGLSINKLILKGSIYELHASRSV